MEEGRKNGTSTANTTKLQLYHWQTDSYARHKASDTFVKHFDALIDRLVEAFQVAHARA